ncbi:hypothetical protein D3C81_1882580 [compost metagenome]
MCLLIRIQLSTSQAINQSIRVNINQLHLICTVKHTVWNAFLYIPSGNGGYYICQTFNLLNIYRCIHINACSDKLLNILISFFVTEARRIRMSQIINQDKLRTSLKSMV